MKRRYDLLYLLGAFVSSPFLVLSLIRSGKWRTDWAGRLGRATPLPPDPRPTILLHGVSVGEINATRALTAWLTRPGSKPVRLVISATTDTGFARASELYSGTSPVVRFPFDFSWMVRRFLDAVRPDVVALMELELWPNLAQECQRRGIPLVVINGRLSDGSFRKYRWARPWVRPTFESLACAAVQTREYARRFEALGTPEGRIQVTDNMKWDTVTLTDEVPGAAELGRAMGIDPERPLVVAGSTGPGEEELLIGSRPEGVQLLVVPRRPERFDEVARLAPGIVRRSQRAGVPSGRGPSGANPWPTGTAGVGRDGPPPRDLFLLDVMGELTKAYALGDVAVVGRSFVPLGGSDPIEPIALGKPTIIGPHHENFRDVVEAFVQADGIHVTDRPADVVRRILANPEEGRALAERGRRVIEGRKGATERHAGILLSLLEKEEGHALEKPGAEGGLRSGGKRRRPLVRWGLRTLLLYLAFGYLTTAIRWIPVSGPNEGGSPGATGSGVVPAVEPGEPAMPSQRVISGVFSVHTERSHDAWGTRDQVAEAARGAGLDFVVIGDHPPDDRRPGWELWEPQFREGVLVVGGQELRAPEAGKILTMGVDTTYKQWLGPYESFRELLTREGATSFVIHGRGPRESERWIHPTVDGLQGWEVLDLSESMRARLRGIWAPYHLLTLMVGSPLGLGDEALLHLMREGFDTPTVAAYDSLRSQAPLTATAGLNHHAKAKVGPWLLPPYEPFFRTLRTHLLVDHSFPTDPQMARDFLGEEARQGDVFISLGDDEAARAFRQGVTSVGGATLGPGAEAPFSPGMVLLAGLAREAPAAAPRRKLLYRIVRDGEVQAWLLGPDLAWTLPGPGLYRVEAYKYALRLGHLFLRCRPWIFSNPVFLR